MMLLHGPSAPPSPSSLSGPLDDAADALWGMIDERVQASLPGWTETAMQTAAAALPAAIEQARPQIEETSRIAIRAALDDETFRAKLGYEKRQLLVGAIVAVTATLLGTLLIVTAACPNKRS